MGFGTATAFILRIFRQLQTTNKSQYRTQEERKEGEKEERKKELHFHQMGVAA